MLIVLSGLSGVGKTTIARELTKAAGAVHVRIDTIEQALRREGVKVETEGYVVAYAIAEELLRGGHVVVADSVNPWPLTRNEWRDVARRAGVSVVEVEVVCSERTEHQRRVETRSADISGHILPTWQDVLDRDYRPWDRERLVIDSARFTPAESAHAILSAPCP